MREQLISQLTEMIDGTDNLSRTKRAELARSHLHQARSAPFPTPDTPGGLLRIDQATIERETNLDGKYLLRCCDPS